MYPNGIAVPVAFCNTLSSVLDIVTSNPVQINGWLAIETVAAFVNILYTASVKWLYADGVSVVSSGLYADQ